MKQRGKFLTIMLIIASVGFVFTAYHIIPLIGQLSTKWLVILVVMNLISSFCAIIGLWFWKKWGVYLLIVTFIFGFIIGVFEIFNIAIGSTGATTGLEYIKKMVIELLYLIPVGVLWYFAIKRKWSYFG